MWAVMGLREISFTVICDRTEQYVIRLTPPMSLIKVKAGCFAYSDVLTLPSQFYGESSYQTENKIKRMPEVINGSNNIIWDSIQPYMGSNFTLDIPQDLKEMKTISMDRLVQTLEQTKLIARGELKKNSKIKIIIYSLICLAIVMVLLVLLVAAVYVWYRYKWIGVFKLATFLKSPKPNLKIKPKAIKSMSL